MVLFSVIRGVASSLSVIRGVASSLVGVSVVRGVVSSFSHIDRPGGMATDVGTSPRGNPLCSHQADVILVRHLHQVSRGVLVIQYNVRLL